ncbi:hypothetical protein Bca4012_063067 [Brassica carinata]
MPERDVVSWNNHIERNLKPDESTIVSTLPDCPALKNFVKIGNASVDMFCKRGCLYKAIAVFNSVRNKNVKCWTSMVTGYVSNGRLDEARELFERSRVKDVSFVDTGQLR